MLVASRLLDAPLKRSKKLHGSHAGEDDQRMGALPSDGSLASLPKMTVKTTIIRNGRISAQAMPITVCL